MEGLPNRKQRREWARQSGMIKKKQKASFKERLEITRRAIEVGKQIHLFNTEKVLRAEEERLNQIKSKKVQELIESGVPLEEALKIVNETD